jgi:putrescine transport system permease protein
MVASLALVLGTFAGFAMVRFTRFRGRAVFGFALLAPLVVPEVILGLSLLLLFVACEALIGWPQGRGILSAVRTVAWIFALSARKSSTASGAKTISKAIPAR